MKAVKVKFKGATSLQMGRYHEDEKLEGELPEEYEKRTWRSKAHADENGNVFIPPMAWTNSLIEAANYEGAKIKGKGQKTWKKKFEAGVICTEPVFIGKKLKDAKQLWVFGHSKGQRRGTGPRVKKAFPTFIEWEGEVTYLILDQIITPEIFIENIVRAGKYIGLGVFRPANGGYYGRFDVIEITWDGKKLDLA